MKKLMLLATVALVAVASQAAAFKFGALNQYAYPGEGTASKYSGSLTIYCSEVADWTFTGTVANGLMDASKTYNQVTDARFKAGESYTFYYTVDQTVGEKTYTYTSSTKLVLAQASDIAPVAFGNQGAASGNKDNWTSTPEPTSAMLMLLGMAGLALRRRRA